MAKKKKSKPSVKSRTLRQVLLASKEDARRDAMARALASAKAKGAQRMLLRDQFLSPSYYGPMTPSQILEQVLTGELTDRQVRKAMESGFLAGDTYPPETSRIERNLRDLVASNPDATQVAKAVGARTPPVIPEPKITPEREFGVPASTVDAVDKMYVERLTRQFDETGYRRAEREAVREAMPLKADIRGVDPLKIQALHRIQGNPKIGTMASEMAKSTSAHLKDPVKIGRQTMMNGLRQIALGEAPAAKLRELVDDFLTDQDAKRLFFARRNPERARAIIWDLLVPPAPTGAPKQVKHPLQYLFRGWLRGPDVSSGSVNWEAIPDMEARRRYVLGLSMAKETDVIAPISGADRQAKIEAKAQALAEKRHLEKLGVSEQYAAENKRYQELAKSAKYSQKALRRAETRLLGMGDVTPERQSILDEMRRRRATGVVPPQEEIGMVKPLKAPKASARRGAELKEALLAAERMAGETVGAARAQSEKMQDLLRSAKGGGPVPKFTPEDLAEAEKLVLGYKKKQGYIPAKAADAVSEGQVLPSSLSEKEIAQLKRNLAASGNEAGLKALEERIAASEAAGIKLPKKLKGGKVGLAALLLMALPMLIGEDNG